MNKIGQPDFTYSILEIIEKIGLVEKTNLGAALEFAKKNFSNLSHEQIEKIAREICSDNSNFELLQQVYRIIENQ